MSGAAARNPDWFARCGPGRHGDRAGRHDAEPRNPGGTQQPAPG